MTKQDKAEYDRLYRLKNKEAIRLKKIKYNESEAGRATQKRARAKRGQEWQNNYCKKPEQREKEKQRRYIRLNQLEEKNCLICNKNKPKIDFIASKIYQDGRMYLCRECEKKHQTELGITTKSVIQVIVTTCDYRLSREDIAKHPYFIEAKKYSIILNKLIK